MTIDLDSIDENMSDEDRRSLINLRGGCRCFISPPCNACCEPRTEDEANRLGLIPEEPGTTEMDAVRELCTRKD